MRSRFSLQAGDAPSSEKLHTVEHVVEDQHFVFRFRAGDRVALDRLLGTRVGRGELGWPDAGRIALKISKALGERSSDHVHPDAA